MTKKELVQLVAENVGCAPETVCNIIERFMDSVKAALADGEEVFLRGFGNFIIKEYPARRVRNISRNRVTMIPARKIPTVRFAKAFRNVVANTTPLPDSKIYHPQKCSLE